MVLRHFGVTRIILYDIGDCLMNNHKLKYERTIEVIQRINNIAERDIAVGLMLSSEIREGLANGWKKGDVYYAISKYTGNFNHKREQAQEMYKWSR